MKIDDVEIGATYRMYGNILDRTVIDILWWPAGEKGCQEYREAILEIVGGKHPGRRDRQSLEWFAENVETKIANL